MLLRAGQPPGEPRNRVQSEAAHVKRVGEWHHSAIVGVFALASVLCLWGVWSFPFSDPDAGMYADIGQHMAMSGDWITPRFNGLRYVEKPPLLYWLIALTYRLTGPSEWGAHLWPALSGIAGVAVTSLIGREAFGPNAGLLAGLILATNVGYFVFARVISTDLLFACFLSLTLFAFLQSYRGRGPRWKLVLYLSLGLAVMTKGIIGILLPGLVVTAFLALVRDLPAFRRVGVWWGMPLVLGLALPWHVAVAARQEGFFRFYVLDNQILRFLGQRAFVEDDVPLSLPAFLLATCTLFSPWSLFLPAALRASVDHLRAATAHGKAILFVLLWAGLIVGFFALSPLKLEHYGIPAFPALALLVGQFWAGFLQQEARPSLWLCLPLVVLSIPALLLGTGVLSLDHAIELAFSTDVYSRMVHEQGESFSWPLLRQLIPLFRGSGIVLFLGGVATLLFVRRRAPRTAFGCFAIMTILLLGLVGKTLAVVSEYRSVKPLAALILQRLGPDDLVLHEGPLENSAGLTFYTGRQIHVVNGRRGDLEFGSHFPEAEGLFWEEAEVLRLWPGARRIFLVTDRPPEHSVLRLMPPQVRHLFGHEGRRWLYTNWTE
jgi:4-amino-4-deoxy-L-arabinose transferase-like glycosyltransferase